MELCDLRILPVRLRITELRSPEPRLPRLRNIQLFDLFGNALKRSSLRRYTLAYLLGQVSRGRTIVAETELEPEIVMHCSWCPRGGSWYPRVHQGSSGSQVPSSPGLTGL